MAHFATFGGASVLASRLVSSLAPPNNFTTKNNPARAANWNGDGMTTLRQMITQ